jgi:hypothetical protein
MTQKVLFRSMGWRKRAPAMATLLFIGCTPAFRSVDGGDGGNAATQAPVATAKDTAGPRFFRAWPAPRPGPGTTVGPAAASGAPLRFVTGEAARTSVPDRCPDHDECHRIANNGADVAHASCDAQCERCCPHESVDECVRRECNGACSRCADDGCHAAICTAVWLAGCRHRCEGEMSACAGCRSTWCAEGAARSACHADVDGLHRATLAACDRDCPAGQRRDDGSCSVTCGTVKSVACSRAAKDCKIGQSPDCRCECTGAVGGGCVAWNALCSCD